MRHRFLHLLTLPALPPASGASFSSRRASARQTRGFSRRARTLSTLVAFLALTACGGLPRTLRNDIASENARLDQAEKQFERSAGNVRDDLSHAPELFNGAPEATGWPADLRAAKTKLDTAENDRRELAKLERSGDKQSLLRAERLLSDEHRLREAALDDARAVEDKATRWLDFQRNTPHYLAKMQDEYDAIRAVDLAPVAKAVEKAEQDWPAKKADLETRLSLLKQEPAKAATEWQTTDAARQSAAAGKLAGPAVAELIRADDALQSESAAFTRDAEQLRAQCGQLYNAWDRILEDLDRAREGPEEVYREKLKTVRTHFVDVAAKKTEVSSDVKWVDVSPSSYRAVENDLGMAIAHKDAGLYDSEAQTVAQPAGFAYIAPPEVGSNQYGYWTHNEHGSFWTFLPEYLIMRELLWGRDYRPIVVNDYNGYSSAQRGGRTWYGQETPAAPPRYGSHGTFTQQRYAGSRYVQSGGFSGSAYSSHGGGSAAAPAPSASPRHDDSPEGHRFGHDSGSAPAGKRFGSGGNAPSSPPPPSGRRFGSGGGSRAPRSFGRRH